MSRPVALAWAAAFLALTGCRSQEAVLRSLPPDAPPIEYSLRIPEGYDVRSAGFGATYKPGDAGNGYLVGPLFLSTDGSAQQQSFVHVFAVERATGQEVLLVYGGDGQRADPLLIYRLERGEAQRQPGPSR